MYSVKEYQLEKIIIQINTSLTIFIESISQPRKGIPIILLFILCIAVLDIRLVEHFG